MAAGKVAPPHQEQVAALAQGLTVREEDVLLPSPRAVVVVVARGAPVAKGMVPLMGPGDDCDGGGDDDAQL